MIKRKWYTKAPPRVSKRRSLDQMPHGELERLLDDEISFWIRASQAAYSHVPGYIQCFTCGSWHHWKDMDAGHFIPRHHRGTRFDLRNIRPQCTQCNSYHEGEHWKFRQALVREYGEQAVQDLEMDASTWGAQRHSREYLIIEIQRWREKNKPLKKWAKGEGQ